MDVPLAEDREFAMLDQAQVNTLNAVERMGATLSLLGISLVFVTFGVFKRLRTIPNTFIFFASIANIGACVACLIAYDGISAMNRDRAAPLCQAQGFIFEWFMQSDPWWSFAMAINVWMVFFMQFNLSSFRRYIWLYCVICYGLPAIPAFVFLFIRSPRGLIYGDAVLWCWIASEWNVLRIYSYYLPIWVCSVLSAVIYFAVGYHVFHTRNQLRNLSLSNQGKEATYDSTDVRDSAEKSERYHERQNLTSHPGPGYYGTVTTEVQVTSSAAAMPAKPLPAYTNPFRDSPSRQTDDLSTRRSSDNLDPCATTATATPMPVMEAGAGGAVHHHHHHREYEYPSSSSSSAAIPNNAPGVMAPIHTHNYPWSREPSSFSPTDVDAKSATMTPTTTTTRGNSNSNSNSNPTPFSFSTGGSTAAPLSTTAGQTNNNNRNNNNTFETTNHGFNTAQYTSISAGSSPPSNDRRPSPTRLLSPISKRSTAGGKGKGKGKGGGGGGGGKELADNGKKTTTTTMTASATSSSSKDDTCDALRSHHQHQHQHQRRHRHRQVLHPVLTRLNLFRRLSDGTRRFGARLRHMDPVKLAYLRTSFVFAISVLVTWTPSSINRVYTLLYPDQASYGLNIAAAVVLPLQGVWNAVIYFTTSWKIFREEVEGTRVGRRLFRWGRRWWHFWTWSSRYAGGSSSSPSSSSSSSSPFSSPSSRRGTTTRSALHGMVVVGGDGSGGVGGEGRGLAMGLSPSSSSAARRELRRSRRLEDKRSRKGVGGVEEVEEEEEDDDDDDDDDVGDEMEMQSQLSQNSPLSSPKIPQQRRGMLPPPPPPAALVRTSTMRVTQKQFEDLAQ